MNHPLLRTLAFGMLVLAACSSSDDDNDKKNDDTEESSSSGGSSSGGKSSSSGGSSSGGNGSSSGSTTTCARDKEACTDDDECAPVESWTCAGESGSYSPSEGVARARCVSGKCFDWRAECDETCADSEATCGSVEYGSCD